MEKSTRIARQVPRQPTPFVGRGDELSHITELMREPACRLLTLFGPGGIGKTRLAIEAAHRLRQEFYFVSLQPLSSPDFLVSAIADALGFQFFPGDDPKNQLLDYLCEKSWLLVLDNFEHLLDGALLLPEILAYAPDIRLLVTSRERLNLVEEWVLEVTGLEYPSTEDDSGAGHYSAFELFVQHARRLKSSFTLTDKSRPAVVRICRLVEGMPLGIELAASWVRAMSCEAIADEIERSLDILETPVRNIEPRHRTMRAALDQSWHLLSDNERYVFMRLSVFRGGFTHEAAAAVAGASLSNLAALVDQSLLRANSDGRYDVHELLRQYADERLVMAGSDEELTRDAHRDYYAAFLDQRVEDLKGRRQLEALAEIAADFENVRIAWNRAAAHKREDAIERMLEGVWVFCDLRHRHQDISTLFRYAVQQVAAQQGSEPLRIWGRLVARAAGITEAFQIQLETALLIARRDDDPAEIAFCLKQLSAIAYEQGDYPKATQLLEQSVAYYRSTSDRYYLAGVLLELGTRNYEGTWDYYVNLGAESLRLRREMGDLIGANWSLGPVAIGEARVGHFAEAERMWLERIAFGYEIVNLDLVASSYAYLSHQIYFIQGDFSRTRATADEALKVAATAQDSNVKGWALVTLGLLASMEERYQEGKDLCQQGASATSFHYIAEFAAWGASIADCGLGDYEAARGSLLAGFKYLMKARGLPGIIACLPIAAILQTQKANPVHAVELLALAFTHPVRAAGWMEKWPLLSRLRAELEQALGSEAFLAAWKRGQRQEVEEVGAELMTQFQVTHPASRENARHLQKDALTARELEILRLVADGRSNSEIAERLVIGVGTVKKHITHFYDKLDAKNRTQAVARARERQLLT